MIKLEKVNIKEQDYLLKNINLEIPEDKLVGIIGENGAGKTTLMKSLLNLNNDYSGIITNDNNNETYIIMQDANSQIVKQTVLKELAFGLENKGIEKEEICSNINNIAEELNIEHLLEQNIEFLSGGEKQLINLASILLLKPQVLIIDEALSMLEISQKIKIIKLLKKYQKQNKITIILSTHENILIKRLDYIIEIANGEIKFQGNNLKYQEEKFQEINHTNSNEFLQFIKLEKKIKELEDKNVEN